MGSYSCSLKKRGKLHASQAILDPPERGGVGWVVRWEVARWGWSGGQDVNAAGTEWDLVCVVRRHRGREAAAVIGGFCGQGVRAASLLDIHLFVIHLFVYLFNSLIPSFICLRISPFADSYRTSDLQMALCLGRKTDLGLNMLHEFSDVPSTATCYC